MSRTAGGAGGSSPLICPTASPESRTVGLAQMRRRRFFDGCVLQGWTCTNEFGFCTDPKGNRWGCPSRTDRFKAAGATGSVLEVQ